MMRIVNTIFIVKMVYMQSIEKILNMTVQNIAG